MSPFRLPFVALLLSGVSLVTAAGCSATSGTDSSSADAVKSTSFDKDHILDDAALVDVDAMSEEQVQAFFEKTPYGTRSGLADYAVGSKSAAALIHDAAVQNRINPLVMLVRLQMEEGLIHMTSVPPTRIEVAFGCGCESASACAQKYLGLDNQAACMARTLRRDVDRLAHGGATISGWKPCVSKKSEDGLAVTPQTAATAALYTYTPWVGEAGGGKTGVGGASLHKQIWAKYATFVGYGAAKSAAPAASICSSSHGGGGATDGGSGGGGTTPASGGCSDDAQCSGATPVCDLVGKKCVACRADYAATNAAPLACPTATTPACVKTGPAAGSCVECTAQNSTVCDASDKRPACNVGTGACGCTDDGQCGADQICDTSAGNGACTDGCKVSGGRDSCGPGKACSVKDGTLGKCVGETCAQTGCSGANPKCDTSAPVPTCVECLANADCARAAGGTVCDTKAKKCVACTATDKSTCDASKVGSACLPSAQCGCVVDADCGGATSGRVCDKNAHACVAGCREVGGNACPAGEECSSSSADVGVCKATPPSTPSTDPGSNGSGGKQPPSGNGGSSSGDGPGATLGAGDGPHVPSKGTGGGSAVAPEDLPKEPSAAPAKSGCAASGSSPADGGLFFAAAALLGAAAKRRRRAA